MNYEFKTLSIVNCQLSILLLFGCQHESQPAYTLVQQDSATCIYHSPTAEGTIRLVATSPSTSRIEHVRGNSIVSSWTLNYPVYRFTCGDVTGDSIPEIIVGPVKATRYRREKDKRLFIFHLYKGTHIRPLWLGSRVGCPLIDFKVETDTMPNMIHTWERKNNGDTIEVLYRQYGFGLKFVRYITNKENKQ